MQTFFKKLCVCLAVIFAVAGGSALATSAPAYADRSTGDIGACTNDDYVLGLTPWDCGIQPFNNQANLINNIALIASNILSDIAVIATYLVIGFVIYGGYLYMFSGGDVGKVASGKKTLTHAFIGLAIVTLANVIFNTIRIALLSASGSFAADCTSTSCVNPVDLVSNLISWFLGSAGAIALIFVFIGGISYMTSSGDSSKLQKAKNTITYSLIGLAIVGLSLIITSFVSGIIRGANAPQPSTTPTPTSYYYNNQIIAKEHYEN